MNLNKEIYDELNNISSLLAGMGKKNIFSVPDGYFDVLTVDTLKKIPSAELATNKSTVPEGYFEGLSSSILNKIKSLQQDEPAQELRILSPMLYSVQNENVFEVPAGYFRDLPDNILAKVIAKPKAKIIQIKKRDSVWKYAAAAVVTGVIGLSSLMMFNSPNQPDKGNDLAVTTSIKDASKFKNEQQIDAGIASLSDDEIIKFLERTGTDVDNEALSKDIDANALPAPEDYLLNEKTLDIYLDKSSKNSQN